MSDAAPADTTPEVEPAPALEATPPADGEGTTTPPEGVDENTASGDDTAKLKKEAQQQRAARRAAEKAAADLQKQLDAVNREKLTDLEKAQADAVAAQERAAAAEARAQQQAAKAAITAAAPAKGIDPTLAHDLLAGRVEFDDAGEPTGITELLDELATKYPTLVTRPGASAGGAPGAAGAAGQPVTETTEQKNARLFGGGQSFW